MKYSTTFIEFPGRQQDINVEQDPAVARHRPGPPVALHRPSHREDDYFRLANTQAQLSCLFSVPRYGYFTYCIS